MTFRRRPLIRALALSLGLLASGVVLVGPTGPAAAAGPTEPSAFQPVEPCRLLDTRTSRRVRAGATVNVDVTGRCGVAADAVAVSVTLTAVSPAAEGFLTAFPSGDVRPGTSVVNYRAGDVIANHQFVRLGDGGDLSVYSLASSDVVVDVTGYFVPAENGRARAGRFVQVTPRRLLDTRERQRPLADSTLRVDVDLDDDVVAVAVNITTAETRSPGHFTAWAAGAAMPESSVLNVDRRGQIRAAAVVVPIDDGGFEIYTAGDNHVIVDITGYFTGPSAERSSEGLFIGVSPTRLVDTRLADGAGGGPRLWDHGTREFPLDAVVSGDVSAIAANVTVTATEDVGHVVVTAARTAPPPTSTINYDRAQQTVANFAIVGASSRGIAANAYEATHIVIDVAGWFTGPSTPTTTGAPRNLPPADRRVTIIGDSAMAGLRWNGAYGGLQGFDAVPILESCRRLVGFSCRGREGYAPRTAFSHILALPAPGPEEILVIATGYNDWHGGFSSAFDQVIAAARQQGFRHIAWIDYRSGVGYRLPGSGGTRSNYGEMNRILGEKLASGDFPEVRRWAFDSYTSGTSGWFTADGVHQTSLGSWGVADWISRHVRAFDDRPCAQPWTAGGAIENRCADPDAVWGERGLPDIVALYGLG